MSSSTAPENATGSQAAAEDSAADDGIKDFRLRWTLTGPKSGSVEFEIAGLLSLYNDNHSYLIDGRLRIVAGHAYYREIGNPRMFVRRNGGEASGRQWGWDLISGKRTCEKLCTMETYFQRIGYWAPSDRTLILSICAEQGWSKRTRYSPSVEVRMC